MAISAISDWLRTKGPYAIGVELLKKHGSPSPPLLFLLGTGETGTSRARLTSSLAELNSASDARVPQPAPKAAPSAVRSPRDIAFYRCNTEDGGRIGDDRLPKELHRTRDELKALHRHESYLRGQLAITPDGEELTILANKVVDVYQRKKKGWLRIEHWRASGEILPERVEKLEDPMSLLLERNSLRVQLSKVKHGRTHPNPERDAARQQRLQDVETKLKEHAAAIV